MENIKLDNSLWLIKAYGELLPNIVFLHRRPMIKLGVETAEDDSEKSIWIPYLNSSMNLDGNLQGVLKGQYRINKNGTKIFDLTKKGHLFVTVEWGGYNRSNMGNGDINANTDNVLFYKKIYNKTSTIGYTYFIIPENFKQI